MADSYERNTKGSERSPGSHGGERGPGGISPLNSKVDALRRLEEIVERLRAPGGCPWDREQTLDSVSPNFLEESCELMDAVAQGGGGNLASSAEICEELGDLLMNIFLAARIAEEAGGFDLAAVTEGICEKLVRRHPHVFGSEKISDSEAVLSRWRVLKAQEKRQKADSGKSILDDVPKGLPALQLAFELGRKAARIGFDWPEVSGALEKIREELEELSCCLDTRPGHPPSTNLRHEVGDLLLAVVNYSRKVGIPPELALREATWRFRTRFRYIEERIEKDKMDSPTLDDMEKLWKEAKRLELE